MNQVKILATPKMTFHLIAHYHKMKKVQVKFHLVKIKNKKNEVTHKIAVIMTTRKKLKILKVKRASKAT